MEIRLACEKDIPDILALLRQVGQVHHEIRPDIFRAGAQKYDEAALQLLLQDESRPIFVADENGRVAGYCFCQLQQCRHDPVMSDRLELYIDDLCVDERCRGQGVATALYRHVSGYAKELGCAFLTLNVWCGNDGALGFYEKMGLRPRKIGMEMPLEDGVC